MALTDDGGNTEGGGEEEEWEDETGERNGAPIRLGHSSFTCGTHHWPIDDGRKSTAGGDEDDPEADGASQEEQRGGSSGDEKNGDARGEGDRRAGSSPPPPLVGLFFRFVSSSASAIRWWSGPSVGVEEETRKRCSTASIHGFHSSKESVWLISGERTTCR